MNIATAAAAFAVCFLFGLWRAGVLRKRAALLRELYAMTEEFAIEIKYITPPLAKLIETARGEFPALVRGYLPDKDIRAAWSAACDTLSACAYCNKEDIALLRELGGLLGRSGAQGQLSLLAMYSERLAALCAAAEEVAARRGKLFRSVGALAGLGIAVMII